jgi:hypothetical protein
MYADGTGLLTDAMHVGRGADRFSSRVLWAISGKLMADIHAAMVRLRARITVAGQWRSFTALPEHSESGQRVGLNGWP